jgi:type IV pilus assembly protein PilC
MAKVLADFYYNLAIMLDAGMPIVRTMDTANKSCKGRMRKVVSDINETITAGNSLADGMKKYPKIFSHFDITAVDAAERSGSLPEVLRLLSEWHHFTTAIKRKIITGLQFPFLILFIAAIVVPLPLVILGKNSFFRGFIESISIIGVFILPAIAIVALIKFTPKRGPFREIFDLVCLKIPLLGKAIKHYAVSRFCYTFYILQKAAMPVADSMKTSLDSTTNAVVAECLKGGLASAEAGHNVSEGLKNPFVDGFVELWAIGEETGQTDTVAKKLADLNKEESFRYFTLFAEWLPKFVYGLICLMMIVMIFRGLSALGSFYQM